MDQSAGQVLSKQLLQAPKSVQRVLNIVVESAQKEEELREEIRTSQAFAVEVDDVIDEMRFLYYCKTDGFRHVDPYIEKVDGKP